MSKRVNWAEKGPKRYIAMVSNMSSQTVTLQKALIVTSTHTHEHRVEVIPKYSLFKRKTNVSSF